VVASGAMSGGPVPGAVRSASRPAPLRLTRRGRVAVVIFFVLLTSAVGVLLASASRASGASLGPAPSVVVQPHDTLWSIASRSVPSRNTRAVVFEIRRLNDIADYTVHPGERLILPRSR
jgi:Tfp pilus assembly protein FimV